MADIRGALILLIDDDVIGRSVRKLVLEANGHVVQATGEAHLAMRVLTSEPVRLVILDYFLNGILGTELARQMRLRKPDVPILLLSASSDVPEGTEHVDAYLSKLEPIGVIEDKIAELLLPREGRMVRPIIQSARARRGPQSKTSRRISTAGQVPNKPSIGHPTPASEAGSAGSARQFAH